MPEARTSTLANRLRAVGVVPVVTIEDARTAVPLARALAAGGLTMVEVVLRTPAALDAIRAIAAEVPECEVGVGTVLSPADLDAGVEAGAAFAVAPGYTPRLLAAGRDAGIPLMPAVATSAEVLQTMEAGYDLLKLFPAEVLGGPELLRMLKGPFPGVQFCCTGGIGLSRLPAYRAEANVAAVGGSFVTPPRAVAEGAWARIGAMAAAARRRWASAPAEALTSPAADVRSVRARGTQKSANPTVAIPH